MNSRLLRKLQENDKEKVILKELVEQYDRKTQLSEVVDSA